MKRTSIVLGVVVSLFLFMPLVANAEKVVANKEDWTLRNYGVIKAGDITYEYTDEAKGIKTWEIYLTPSSNITHIYLELLPTKLEIQKI